MAAEDTPTVLAEVAVEPAALGREHGEIVAAAIAKLGEGAVTVQRGAAGTVVHGPLDEVLRVVRGAHDLARARAERVITQVRLESHNDGSSFEERLRQT